jgi:hypothetical protein
MRKQLLGCLCCLLFGAALAIPRAAGKDAAQAVKPSRFVVEPYLQLPTPTGMTVMWETNTESPSQVDYGTTRSLGQRVRREARTALHEVRLQGLKPGARYFYQVRSGELVSEVFSFKTAPAPGTKRWRLAVYGDSRSNPRVHRRVAEQIARARVDLIVHTGDIVVNGKIHRTWQVEFFGPLGKLARSVPWVSSIGNHEADSENYFSYMALPGNERYFGFDYANAHIVCLDSNAWIARGRDSRQYQWADEHFKEKRSATWTLVAFHHPLFSAHATRPINPLRWDWAPLLLDPANRVDVVLTGHDHFYARNFRMGRLQDQPQAGVLFLTTAGGGAGLYPCLARDYVARTRSVHHFTLFDFDGDQVQVSAIDQNGKVFDRYQLTRRPTPPAEFCAFEVEEVRRFLRLGLARHPPSEVKSRAQHWLIDDQLRVPTRFRVPVSGSLIWDRSEGWTLKRSEVKFQIKPGQALEIPLQAEVRRHALGSNPELTIAFDAGKFRNRTIRFNPWKYAGPKEVAVSKVDRPLMQEGRDTDRTWKKATAYLLFPLTQPVSHRSDTTGSGAVGEATKAAPVEDRVRLLANKDWLFIRTEMADPQGHVSVPAPDPCAEGSRLVLSGEHVRVVLSDGRSIRTFAVSPESFRYYAVNGQEDSARTWSAVVNRTQEAWSVQVAIPRKYFSNPDRVRINVVHRRRIPDAKPPRQYQDCELCPTYEMGADPDLLPDWKTGDKVERFAHLIWP